MGEVGEFGSSAEGVVVGVVDLAADRGDAASGEPAVLIPGLQEPSHRGWHAVRVGRDGDAGGGVVEQAFPDVRRPGEKAGGRGVNRGSAREIARPVVRTGEGRGGHKNLHPRADRAEGPGGRVARVIQRRGACEQQVGEHVGPDLIGRSCICRDNVGVLAGSTLMPGVDDRPCLLRQPVVDPLRDHRREGRDQVAHPIPPRHQSHAPARGCLFVPFRERSWVHPVREDLELTPDSVRRLTVAAFDRDGFELGPQFRGQVQPGVDDRFHVALWHERDISHSSVERGIGPDATIHLDFALHRLANVVERLNVYPENMQKNIDRLGGLVHSQRVMLALTQAGVSREDAYAAVQENAMKVWRGEGAFLDFLKADERVTLPADQLEALFDLGYHTKNVDVVFKRVFGDA